MPDDWLTAWFVRRFNWTPSQIDAEDPVRLLRLRDLIGAMDEESRKTT